MLAELGSQNCLLKGITKNHDMTEHDVNLSLYTSRVSL